MRLSYLGQCENVMLKKKHGMISERNKSFVGFLFSDLMKTTRKCVNAIKSPGKN